ncbi:MAG: primosomal protein N' [Puniceicoccales bacterium]|jgi:primosomal protein N'|nr:primosomal protein N' [Puniceicoccales bacterium]
MRYSFLKSTPPRAKFYIAKSHDPAAVKELCATVELFDAVGKPLFYAIPAPAKSNIFEGTLVRVPLNNRFATGVVTEIGEPTYSGKLKSIQEVIYNLPQDLMALANWLCRYHGTSLSSTLGVIVPREMRKKRKNSHILTERITLKNHSNDNALARDLVSNMHSGKFRTFLLHEWNFYKRAEIYAAVAAAAVNSGKNVLILAPEISKVERLAKQMEHHLAINCFLWHGRLTSGDRATIWNTLIDGNGPFIAIGTPAAVFLPIAVPRLIIADNEEDTSYKREKMPRFHLRDCAVCRGWLNQGLCILGSGAPSMESIHSCRRGKFQYISSNGPTPGEMGNIHIIDTRKNDQNRFLITTSMERELKTCIQNNRQGILIFNRLGYGKYIFCHRCTLELACPKCCAPMALRRGQKQRFCPICSHVERHTIYCPNCHTPFLRARGTGIERIEEILRQIFHGFRILRCDHSTLSSPKKISALQDAMQNERIDIVIGTHAAIDLIRVPRIGLVGILDIDQELHRLDFRASERTFQTISKICHMCAAPVEKSEPIPLILQTRDPKSVILNAVISGDPTSFYEREFADRKILGYPPHRHLVQQRFFGQVDEVVQRFADEWATLLRAKMKKAKRSDESFQLNGPRKLQPHKGDECHCLWYFTENPIFLTGKLREIYEEMPQSKEVKYFWDMDAVDLL